MRKTLTIQLRVTPEQHATYTKKAKAFGISVAEWFRSLADDNDGIPQLPSGLQRPRGEK
jgi:hypothetical protein